MTRATIAGGAFVAVLVLLSVVAAYRAREHDDERAAARPRARTPSAEATEASKAEADAADHAGFLHGRVTTDAGVTYEGRLRWGGDEEAFWGDTLNGAKKENPWAAHVPPERLPEPPRPMEIFGIRIGRSEPRAPLRRPFMARFGDVARIEAHGLHVRVTLKSGTAFELDRLDASDFDDGVRVWDARHGVVDLDSLRIRAIELHPTATPDDAPLRLHGTVRTRQGEFTGFLQWDRQDCVGSDELDGRTADGEVGLRFDAIRSIERRPRGDCLVTLLDGRAMALSGTREVGDGNRGISVEDRRYGRVLVSWGAFERVDFSAGGSGPAYGDFPPGDPLAGSVATRDGSRLAGRLVYDLDESETTETLDAPSRGVDYTIPFGLIASIVVPDGDARAARHARVTLHGGAELELERDGDLGDRNGGVLVFAEGGGRPEHVPWAAVERIDFDRPPAMQPQLPSP